MSLTKLTIKKIRKGLSQKEFSAKELCQAFFDQIQKKNDQIFAYLTLAREQAFKQAEKIDQLISSNLKLSKLSGTPIAIKDNILVEGLKCTAGSKILENYIAPFDATAIKKLKEAGAVILGKTNLDEFGMGSSTEYSAFGPTKNPIDLTKVPGGSSGGSGAALAAQMAPVALGSDTGGSVRQPAAFCGLVGLKPTYGAISRYGLIALASSLDQIGILGREVEDVKAVFEVISGKDSFDSTSSDFQNIKSNIKIKKFKIGIPKEYFIKGLNREVEQRVKTAAKVYERLGLLIEEISLPHTEYALPCYYLVMSAEVSANLARYEGIKYGKSKISDKKSKIKNLMEVYFETRKEYLGPEVKRRIMLGTFALSAGYYDAYYLKAQRVRTKIREDFEKAFEKVDLLLTPTSPTTAFNLGEKIQNPLLMYLADIFTVPVNLAGLPAISIPCGKVGPLPVGFQLIGNHFQEELLFKVADLFEYANH